MMPRNAIAALAAAALLAGCDSGPADPAPETAAPPQDLAPDPGRGDRALLERLATEHIIVDTHIDLPMKLHLRPDELQSPRKSGDFDFDRARAGRLDVAFMSIYTSAEQAVRGESYAAANELIDLVEALIQAFPDRYAPADSVDAVRRNFARGLISLPLGMENGSPLDGDLANVEKFYARGVRYITLAHSKANALSDSSYDTDRPWKGLSDFGITVVKEMNRLGMMVDVSHLSDAAFYDVLDTSNVPVIASHSSARRFTPGFERNMSDDMIRALAEQGGIIMINFGSTFLTGAANSYASARSAARRSYKLTQADSGSDAEDDEFDALFARVHGPFPFADLGDVLDHIDHVVDLVGVEHVGIGSDYDGVGDSLPIGLKDVSSFPNLIRGLLQRGYSEDDIAGILGENLLRVWAEVEARAAPGR